MLQDAIDHGHPSSILEGLLGGGEQEGAQQKAAAKPAPARRPSWPLRRKASPVAAAAPANGGGRRRRGSISSLGMGAGLQPLRRAPAEPANALKEADPSKALGGPAGEVTAPPAKGKKEWKQKQRRASAFAALYGDNAASRAYGEPSDGSGGATSKEAPVKAPLPAFGVPEPLPKVKVSERLPTELDGAHDESGYASGGCSSARSSSAESAIDTESLWRDVLLSEESYSASRLTEGALSRASSGAESALVMLTHIADLSEFAETPFVDGTDEISPRSAGGLSARSHFSDRSSSGCKERDREPPHSFRVGPLHAVRRVRTVALSAVAVGRR